MVPRNVARISEDVRNKSEVPGTGRNQLALSAGAPTTTGTDDPVKNCSSVPASTVCVLAAQNVEPCAGAPSTTPSASSHTASFTCSSTGVATLIVVLLVNV